MSNNVTQFPNFPRAVRSAPDPLALYLRPGRNDHLELLKLMASGSTACFGSVFDPTLVDRHKELRNEVLRLGQDAILDPKTQQLALPGSFSPTLSALPWGNDRPHGVADFQGTSGRRLVATIADFAIEHGFTQVMAPTHVLGSADDPWAAVDADAARRLRTRLDRQQGSEIPLIYSLAIPYSVFCNAEQHGKIIGRLKTVPATAIWLKIDRFGSNGSPTSVRNYIEASADFHELGIPVVADHVGGVAGLSLLAFGATGGISHGITMGERFDASGWRKVQKGSPFTPARRIYIPALDLLLKKADAEALFAASTRAKGLFGCADTNCCPRGIKDQIENPAQHFLRQRISEVNGLGKVPEQLRPQRFLDQHLRPATDKALAAATTNWDDDAMAKKMQDNRKRLDSLRIALGNHAEKTPPKSFALLPETRVVREARG